MAEDALTATESTDSEVVEPEISMVGREFTFDGETFVAIRSEDIDFTKIPYRVLVEELSIPTVGRLRRLITEVETLQADQADAARPALLKAMLTADIDPVPAATIAQARRLAQQRERLLASGAYTIDALRELRGDAKSSTTRTWLTRRRAAHDLFTVTHDGTALVPAFQLDRESQPVSGLHPVLEALAPAELGSWATWTWFTAASSWLSGAVPADLLESDPERVATAARRFASNAA